MGYLVYRDNHAPTFLWAPASHLPNRYQKRNSKTGGSHHGSPGHIACEGLEPRIQNPPLPSPSPMQASSAQPGGHSRPHVIKGRPLALR